MTVPAVVGHAPGGRRGRGARRRLRRPRRARGEREAARRRDRARTPSRARRSRRATTVLLVVSTGPTQRDACRMSSARRESKAVADLTAAGFEPEVTEVVLGQDKRASSSRTEPEAGTDAEGRLRRRAHRLEGRPSPSRCRTSSARPRPRRPTTLRDAGLEVNVVAVPSDQPSGTVVAQNPRRASDAKQGSTVRLNVAQEPGATTTTTDDHHDRDDHDRAGATTRPAPATAATVPGCRRQGARRRGA